MKIVIFGLGSIGQRHLEILNKNYKFDIYAFRSGLGKGLINSPPVICHGCCQVEGVPCKFIYDWHEVDRIKPDVAIITNPTHLHIETAIKCLEHGIKYLLIEKPLSCNLDKLDVLLNLADKNKATVYIAYPFRHHIELQKLKKPYYDRWLYFVCHTDCRKWTSKRKNDGALLELSHELDLAQYYLGKVKSISNSLPTIFDAYLDLDSECWLRVEHCNKNLSFHNLNILAPKEQRFLKFRGGEKVAYSQNDSMYERQLNYFFANLDNPYLQNNVFEAADLFRKIVDFKSREGTNS